MPASPFLVIRELPALPPIKKHARRSGAAGGGSHFAPAAIAAAVNSFKAQNV